MTDDISPQIDDANSPEGVVFANKKLPALGWYINYAIYDGGADLKEFIQSLYRYYGGENDEEFGDNKEHAAEFSSNYRRLIPLPRHGGGAFAHAVRSLQTKAQRVVYDDPSNPLSNNKEKMRVKKNQEYGYNIQWNIVPIRKNQEYALQRTRRGYVDGQPRLQVVTDAPYRVRIDTKNITAFTRKWRLDLLAHIWDGEKAPDTSELRNTVTVEPMKDSALPDDGRFMRLAQERLRNAYVSASMDIDDDKIRKIVRGRLKALGAIMPHASSGGVYFLYDPEKRHANTLGKIDDIITHFATLANSSDRDAMWVERATPWWEALNTDAPNEEYPIMAHYESGFRTMTYGSSKRQLEDIKKMYITNMQNAQAKYYKLVHQMLRDGKIDEELLQSKKVEAMLTLSKASSDLGAETVDKATEAYEEVVEGLTSRFQDMWTAEERVTEAERKQVDERIHSLLSLRLS
ncbi:hypothetical protein N9X64_00625 [bacterium]|nr:hypothetical protein [bacterium]